jgi:hypothetical protein
MTESSSDRPSQGTVSLNLVLAEPRVVPADLAERWQGMRRCVDDPLDFSHLVFLGELLGLLDGDPAPQFRCESYSDVDMFGGRDQDWTLLTRRAAIHRVIKKEINESWQHVDVEADTLEITGLPDEVFIEWDGNIIGTMRLAVGNVRQDIGAAVLALAGRVFSSVVEETLSGSPHGALQAEPRRERRPGALATILRRLTPGREAGDPGVGLAASAGLRAANALHRGQAAALALTQALADRAGAARQVAAEAAGRRDDGAPVPVLPAAPEPEPRKFEWPQFPQKVFIDGSRAWTATFDSYDQRNDDCYYRVKLYAGELLQAQFVVKADIGWAGEDWTGSDFTERLRAAIGAVAATGQTNTGYAGYGTG